MAAIKCYGRKAITNFEPSTYEGEIIVDDNGQGNIIIDFNLLFNAVSGGIESERWVPG